jgi:adenylosuccinate lyase
MIERYLDQRVEKIWSDENKLKLWEKTELAFIAALIFMGLAPKTVLRRIKSI